VSVEAGIGPDCRDRCGFDMPVEPSIREEANQLVREIASGTLDSSALKDALYALRALGFDNLVERIEERLWRVLQPMLPLTEAVVEPEAEPEAEPEIIPLPVPAPAVDPDPLPFTLTAGQEQACEMVKRLMAKIEPSVGFVVGFAGTGKTTTLRAFAKYFGRPVVICPTGKAAQRVTEATGLAAQTIHRWMYKPVEDPDTGVVRFARRYPDEIQTPPSRLVLLDEASMVGPDLWKDVWGICKELNLRLVCVGDGFQLPPVQPSDAKPFSLLIPEFAASLKAERIELTEVLRQAQDSPIIRASMKLRIGYGLRALIELPRILTPQLADVAIQTYRVGGTTICHRNVTRVKANIGIRSTLGIYDEMPQPNEPLVVLKNNYVVGLYNGEAFSFGGWMMEPIERSIIYDRWHHVEEDVRFGATVVGNVVATLAVEEIHGQLKSGFSPIAVAASRWARPRALYVGDTVAPHIHANFGYAYTCHKVQGSQYPYVIVILEPSVRLDEEDGRRWLYTAITRATQMAAVHYGSI
jgi:exodeoxyribonuclease-5